MSKGLPAEEERKEVFKHIIHPKKRAFLIAFSCSGQIRQSCEAAGIHWTSHYHWKRVDKKYREAVAAAEQIAADFMEDEIHRGAFDGIDHPVTYEGKITTTYKVYSDNLAMFRLKKIRPEYRDGYNFQAFNGPVQLNVRFPADIASPLDDVAKLIGYDPDPDKH